MQFTGAQSTGIYRVHGTGVQISNIQSSGVQSTDVKILCTGTRKVYACNLPKSLEKHKPLTGGIQELAR